MWVWVRWVNYTFHFSPYLTPKKMKSLLSSNHCIRLVLIFCSIIYLAACTSDSATQTQPKKQTTTQKTPKEAKKQNLILPHKIKESTSKTSTNPTMILLHGMGSNEDDLFSFEKMIQDRFTIISVRAPYTVAQGKYRWYQGSYSGPKPIIRHDQVEASLQKLTQFIDEAVKEYSLDPNQIYIGGFSQGAIMSMAIGMTAPDKIAGLAAFSGRFIPELKEKMEDKESIQKLDIFISHGTKDQVLKFDGAKDANRLFEEIGANVTFKSYETAHTISRENLKDFLDWLHAR